MYRCYRCGDRGYCYEGQDSTGPVYYVVECDTCGASGPEKSSFEKAVEAWNERLYHE